MLLMPVVLDGIVSNSGGQFGNRYGALMVILVIWRRSFDRKGRGLRGPLPTSGTVARRDLDATPARPSRPTLLLLQAFLDELCFNMDAPPLVRWCVALFLEFLNEKPENFVVAALLPPYVGAEQCGLLLRAFLFSN